MADCSLSTYLPVASALLGAITGGGIGFLTARFTTNRNARAAAAGKLRAAFVPELVAMRFDRGKEKFDADQLLREAFPRHAEAVEEFRFFVRPRDKDSYEQAWRKYYEVGGSVRFFDYMMGDDPLGCFETRVAAILRFAN
jgi:hypothetical protein